MEKSGLFIGLNTLDVQFLVERYPGANEKTKASGYGLYAGGPATNAAIAFAHLGGSAKLASSIGRHPLAGLIKAEMQQYHVEPYDFTPERTCHPVFASVVTTQTTGERSIVSYNPDFHSHNYDHLKSITVSNTDIILTDSFYISEACHLIEHSNGRVPVVMDGGSWKKGLEALLPLVDVAICSADFYPPGTQTSQQVMDYLSSHGISHIAITRGSQSILAFEKGDAFEIPVTPVNALDTLGAGDVFHGAFCYYYLEGEGFVSSLSKAAMVAARSCLSHGTREWMRL